MHYTIYVASLFILGIYFIHLNPAEFLITVSYVYIIQRRVCVWALFATPSTGTA